ncbi:MAG: heparinase II/III family protein [Pseudomonadota bacterium]
MFPSNSSITDYGARISEMWREGNLLVRRSLPNVTWLNATWPNVIWFDGIWPSVHLQGGRAAEKGIVAIPETLQTGTPEEARRYYSGSYTFAGHTVRTEGECPFDLVAPSDAWSDALHAFDWLPHLQAAGFGLSQSHATALVKDWIERHGKPDLSPVWAVETTARRLMALLSAAHFLQSNRSKQFSNRLFDTLKLHFAHLYRTRSLTRPGLPLLQAQIALLYGALCVDQRDRVARQISREVERSLDRQILDDGIHISRSPATLMTLARDLLPLEALGRETGLPVPANLATVTRRIATALRFFRHDDGSLAQFHGTGAIDKTQLSHLLKRAKATEPVPRSAPFGGFERLSSGSTCIIMDTGSPLAHAQNSDPFAGTLAFELSSNKTVFIANCGVPQLECARYLPFARTSAAHSTAVLDDSSSARFASRPFAKRDTIARMVDGPRTVNAKREIQGKTEIITASHDGYENRFGLIHERTVSLGENGSLVEGEDHFIPRKGEKTTQPVAVAIRFHLPPGIKANALADGTSVLIASGARTAWTFSLHADAVRTEEGAQMRPQDLRVEIEESVSFSAPDQPRKAEQIVVHATLFGETRIGWHLSRRAQVRNRKSEASTKAPVQGTLEIFNAPRSDAANAH